MQHRHPFLDLVISDFGVSPQLVEQHKEQLHWQGANPVALKEKLLKLKITNEINFQKALARYYDLEFVEDLSRVGVEDGFKLGHFTEVIPIRYAKKFMFFPIIKEGLDLKVAMEDPNNYQPLDDLGRQFKCRVLPVISHQQAILDLINRAYERSTGTDQMVGELDTTEGFESIFSYEEPEDLLDTADEEPIKRVVNNVLYEAAQDNASDIHIDPSPTETTVRFRVDGVLHIITNVPKQAHVALINRIKVMSRLDIAQKGLPQDGRAMVLIRGRKVDIRVSTVPTVHGEKVVMRLLYQSDKLMTLQDLGLSERIRGGFGRMIQRSNGIILVTGPTGSGKTTTLYAALGQLNKVNKNIITIEDPVEYKINGYSQIEINTKLGLTFANALRSVLRQDPDIIMVGEMRDAETAQIAIQSALTGHLVFSTVHTNSAPGTITRLIDMRVEPFLVASTIAAVLAQRLVRRICEFCKESYHPHDEELREAGISNEQLQESGGVLYRGKGCEKCRNTGYRGRMGLHELLLMNDQLKTVIMESNDANIIKRTAMQHGMISLRMDGAEKALAGLTTLEEVLAITNED